MFGVLRQYFILFSFVVMMMQMLVAEEHIYDLDFFAFQDPQKTEQFQGKKVKIRGFLYTNQQNQWVLSHQPNVKTCCVNKLANPLFLEGNFDFQD